MEPCDVWNRILERAGSTLAGLTAAERIVYRVNVFLVDVEMGGLSGFLYNISPSSGRRWSDLRETAEAVESVGHVRTAALLRDLAARLEALPSGGTTTWGEFFAPLEGHLETDVVPAVNGYIEDLYSKLEAFTNQHLG
jgi:hypothetical protein